MRSMGIGTSIAVLAALAAMGPGWSQEPGAITPAVADRPVMGRPDMPGEPAVPTEPPVTPPVEPATETSVLLERGPVPITWPTEAVPVTVRPRTAVPESMLTDARCRLRYQSDSGWFLLEFLDGLPGGFPQRMRVLPGRELELLEVLAAQDGQAEFRVTGQTTAYRGKAYILPLGIARESPAWPEASEQPPAPAGEAEAEQNQAATSAPAVRDDTERIRTSLMKDRPARPVLPAPVQREPSRAEAGEAVSRPPAAPPAGDILIDRTVRIAPAADGEWMEARFEADNTLQERPLPLLPCRLLERAEAIHGKLRITGILRRYKGRDYLLLRKALVERDMGQL